MYINLRKDDQGRPPLIGGWSQSVLYLEVQWMVPMPAHVRFFGKVNRGKPEQARPRLV